MVLYTRQLLKTMTPPLFIFSPESGKAALNHTVKVSKIFSCPLAQVSPDKSGEYCNH